MFKFNTGETSGAHHLKAITQETDTRDAEESFASPLYPWELAIAQAIQPAYGPASPAHESPNKPTAGLN